MNVLIKKLKLYRVVTVFHMIPQFWKTSKVIAKREKASTCRVYRDMWSCFRKYGSSDKDYIQFHFYGKDHVYKDSFVTWRKNYDIMVKFNSQRVIELFKDKGAWIMRYKKFVIHDWILSTKATAESLTEFIEKHGRVVVKPLKGCWGVGVKILSIADIDRKIMTDLLRREYIIEEVLENIPEIKKFNPASLNTIRAVTIIDNKGNVNIIQLLLRFGVGEHCTDNFVREVLDVLLILRRELFVM